MQKTLLLKKEVEISKVQYELDAKKKEFAERMEACKRKEGELKKKQQVVSDHITISIVIYFAVIQQGYTNSHGGRGEADVY